MGLGRWLVAVLDLFADVLNAVAGVPVFSFFLAFLLFYSLVALLAALVRKGRSGRL